MWVLSDSRAPSIRFNTESFDYESYYDGRGDRVRIEAEWVLIANLQADENFKVESGTVVAHSKDREEMYRLAADVGDFAVLYTGKLPQDMAILL